jgi:Zn-dependent protease
MPGRNVRIGRIAGIPVGISPWWLLVVGLLTWSLAEQYFPQAAPGLGGVATTALALASVLTLFAGILAHEFGHALVARRAGVEIEEIDLWLLGGVARMKGRPRRARDELRFSLAGPAVTVVLAIACAVPALALEASALQAFLAYQAQANGAIALFNLLPALPLDGGRAARALLWGRTGDFTRATLVAAHAGRWTGWGLIALGLFATLAGVLAGVWFVMIGLFLTAAATAEQRQAELMRRLDDAPAGAVMTAEPAPTMAASDPELLIGEDEPAAALLERPAFLTSGRAIVVDEAGHPVGVITLIELERSVGSRPLAGAAR